MKHHPLILAAAFFGSILSVSADLTIPSDGSDGNFNPATSVQIDLGLAANGAWNNPGSGNGVYDTDKWAVVYKFSSVNIPNGVTVSFKNHPSHAPVVWLVQGNVTINGIVNIAGQEAATPDPTLGLLPRESGPGGFRGAAFGPSGRGSGYGPGGAGPSGYTTGHGQYLTAYGNPQIIPLIGGSGGGSYQYSSTIAAGGGASRTYSGSVSPPRRSP